MNFGGNKLEEVNEIKCGIIMPIAAMPGYTTEHWLEVKNIIKEATDGIEGYNITTEIVSNSDGEIDVIHKRIIQNLYNADIVVCDISGRNPNVLFELGMRLTFDKPTVLIKDNITDFIFDTGVIEHLSYPKELHYNKIVLFKNELAKRIKATYEKSKSDANYSTFLKSFGEFKIPSLEQTTVSDVNQVILDELNTIRRELSIVKKEIAGTTHSSYSKYLSINKKKDYSSIINATLDYINSKEYSLNPLTKNQFKQYLVDSGVDVNSYTETDFISLFNLLSEESKNKKAE